MDYELITPTKDLVLQYNAFWTEDRPESWEVALFKGRDPVNITSYISETEFRQMRDDDTRIVKYVTAKDLTALTEINKVYHTRMNAKLVVEKLESWDNLCEMDLDEFVNFCKEVTTIKTYSFATKVFSFIKQNCPILDSYVVTLLDYYLSKKKETDHIEYPDKSNWGSYEAFRNAYDAFRAAYQLKDCNYKQIDHFLWTYGKVLQAYWQANGVLAFVSVSYSAPKQKP